MNLEPVCIEKAEHFKVNLSRNDTCRPNISSQYKLTILQWERTQEHTGIKMKQNRKTNLGLDSYFSISARTHTHKDACNPGTEGGRLRVGEDGHWSCWQETLSQGTKAEKDAGLPAHPHLHAHIKITCAHTDTNNLKP